MINSNEGREIEVHYVAVHRVSQKSVNLKYYLLLTENFGFNLPVNLCKGVTAFWLVQ